ncbi:hypothetical protein [Burkholderia cenocepacia]|uniref:hypothetical protein n=1 Tax=Burkholderia cenocepacia TaxID=95486 RepID=UPI001629F387|nr:hypothetical protein [Burkholderia cenocepacia]MBR7985168.1 hypothetical protein [Burkholderia cenocepacia]MBR8077647.1 hypothetical protein [Burkholderia cenocepacia]
MDLFADDQLHVLRANENVLVHAKTRAMVTIDGASMIIETVSSSIVRVNSVSQQLRSRSKGAAISLSTCRNCG